MRKTPNPDNPVAPVPVFLLAEASGPLRPLRLALTAAGYPVETASDAAGAAEKLSARRPGLLVVDLGLAGPDGLPIWYRLVADPELESVPVLALTSSREAADQWRELGGLFDEYLFEPIDPPAVLSQIQALLTKPSQDPSAGDGVRAPTAPPATLFCDSLSKAEAVLEEIDTGCPDAQFQSGTAAALHQLAQAVASFDLADLPAHLQQAGRLTAAATARSVCAFRSIIRLCREILDRDPDPAPEFVELRAQYLDNRAAEVGTLAGALDGSEFAKLAAAGHNLKGTGAAYGFGELTELGRALETAAKAADPLHVEILLGRTAFYLALVSHSSDAA